MFRDMIGVFVSGSSGGLNKLKLNLKKVLFQFNEKNISLKLLLNYCSSLLSKNNA